MNADNIPLTREQMTIVGMAVAVIAVTIASPMLLAPSTSPATDGANNGTVYTDTAPATATPASDDTDNTNDRIEELNNDRRQPSTNLSQVPDSHVDANGSEPPVSASTGAQTLRVSTTSIDGESALNLTDSRQHDGRWVSVSTEWLESEYGTVPDVVGVAHESGDTYSEPVHARNGKAVFWVRGFSTNIVTFGGVLKISGQPAATGTTHLYEVQELDSATDPEIQLTGQVNSERDTKQVLNAANGESIPLSVAGNLQPQNPEVTFTGIEQQSTDASLFSSTFSDSDSTTYSVDGNSDATDVSVTFSGKSSTNSEVVSKTALSNGESFSYQVGGNTQTKDASVTFTGDSSATDQTDSGNDLSLSATESIDIGGNLDPTGPSGNNNPELTLSPAPDSKSELDSSGSDNPLWGYDAGEDVYYKGEYGIKSVPPSIDSVTVDIPNSETNGHTTIIDVYVDSGMPDGSPTDGTLVTSGHSVSSGVSGEYTIPFDTYEPSGENIHISFVTTSSGAEAAGETEKYYIDGRDVSEERVWRVNKYGDAKLSRQGAIKVSGSGATNVEVTASDGTSHSFGTITTKETASYPISAGVSSIDISGTGAVDYTLDYSERTATEDPSIDVDGDGTDEASHNGVLTSGQTATKSISNLSPGSKTAAISTSASQTDVTIDLTETTATKDPAVDIDDDGQSEASYDGVLLDGENVTRSVENVPSGTQTATVSTGHKVGVTAGSTVRTVTEDPTLDIDGDGQPEAEHLGKLADDETKTVQISEFDRNVTSATVGTNEGVVDVDLGYTERVVTENAGVIVNGNPVRMDGTLSQDDTTTLTADSAWLQSGENNVTVVAGDGDLSTDAPKPTVAITYQHDLTTRRTVTFEDEAFSERYNISRTYLSSREEATLTIPHAENIISLRTLEARIGESGGWTTIPDSALTMDGTSAVIDVAALTGGTVDADTTVEIRSTGSKVNVHNGTVTVVETTPVGYDLDSRLRLDSWSSDSYISVRNTSQAELLHYGANESYTAESDYAELSTSHGQRVHFPAATSGSEVGLKTVPLKLSPANGTIRASVPEDQTNATAPVFSVSPGDRRGDAFGVEYTGASDGSWYGVYEVDTTKRFDRAQGQQQMAVPTDDIDSLIRVKTAPAPSSDPEPASSIFEAASEGNFLELSLLFGGVALLIVVGRRPERSRAGIDSIAQRAGALVERVPRGDLLSGVVEAAITTVGDAIVTVGENEVLTAAVGLATVAMAIQSGLLQIGPEAGAIGTVAAIAIGSLLVLIRSNEFTTARWLGIVGVSAVVALQALGQGDLLTTLVESDAFVLVLILVGYVVIQLVREYRANNSPDDDRPQVNIVADRGGDK